MLTHTIRLLSQNALPAKTGSKDTTRTISTRKASANGQQHSTENTTKDKSHTNHNQKRTKSQLQEHLMRLMARNLARKVKMNNKTNKPKYQSPSHNKVEAVAQEAQIKTKESERHSKIKVITQNDQTTGLSSTSVESLGSSEQLGPVLSDSALESSM